MTPEERLLKIINLRAEKADIADKFEDEIIDYKKAIDAQKLKFKPELDAIDIELAQLEKELLAGMTEKTITVDGIGRATKIITNKLTVVRPLELFREIEKQLPAVVNKVEFSFPEKAIISYINEGILITSEAKVDPKESLRITVTAQ